MKKYFPKKNFCYLKQRIKELLPQKLKDLNEIKANYGEIKMGEFTVKQVIGGMRGINALFYETSKLHSNKGIMYRDHNLFDLAERLKYNNSSGPLSEALLWLLFTGEIPSRKQVEEMITELHKRSEISKSTINLINSLPKHMHPMTQLSIAVLSLQTESAFAKAYRLGIDKSNYWEYYYEDSMNLIAKLPRLAAIIYNNIFHNRSTTKINTNYHHSQNFANMLGIDTEGFDNIVSHYILLHADHEGGNVSAHSVHLVGSSLSDPYYAFSAGLNGLAGPLHGLANEESLRWLLSCQLDLGNNPNDIDVEEYIRHTLDAGKVIPGYGHAVLREIDPRYTLFSNLGDKYLPDFELFKLVKQCLKVVPKVLQETGKVKNPWPNVDCISGVMLYYYGLREFDFYTVMFGVSRAMGTLAMLTWARAYGLPIERPGSVTLEWIKDNIRK
jgi:citrate synthase